MLCGIGFVICAALVKTQSKRRARELERLSRPLSAVEQRFAARMREQDRRPECGAVLSAYNTLVADYKTGRKRLTAGNATLTRRRGSEETQTYAGNRA
jgi:hypothetical protein